MPTVSVIMGVRNSESSVKECVTSVLDQTYHNIEFIVVNDGSTDQTGVMLDQLATTDHRLHVIHQPSQGLTRSLITATNLSQGKYVARQDADDVSTPNRIEKQVAALDGHSAAALATCWVDDVTEDGTVCATHRQIAHSVALTSGEEYALTGVPAHGSVMMRKSALNAAGGYRSCFYYAQDSDLWLRLSEYGDFVVVPEVLYRRTIGTGCISSRFRKAQQTFCQLAEESFRAVKDGRSDEPFLMEAKNLAEHCRLKKDKRTSRYDQATSLMLLAGQLWERAPELSEKYLLTAVKTCPGHWRSWKALLLNKFKRSPAREERLVSQQDDGER